MKRIEHMMICIALSFFASDLSAAMPDDVVTFVQDYCVKCHGAEKQKADRRFDRLTQELNDHDSLETWQEILDLINLDEMPPKKAEQPTAELKKKMVAIMTQRIADAQIQMKSKGRHTVLRRLNKHEYKYTVADLLGQNVDFWDPAADFPADEEIDGFDNNGEALVTSSMLLGHYLSSAEKLVKRSTDFGPMPESKIWRQKSPFYYSDKHYFANEVPPVFKTGRFRFFREEPFTDLVGRHYRGGHVGFIPWAGFELKTEDNKAALKAAKKAKKVTNKGERSGAEIEKSVSRKSPTIGAPATGYYTIRVKAAALGRKHPYGGALDDMRYGDPIVMEAIAVDRNGSEADTRKLGRYELTSETPDWYTFKNVYLDKGYEPQIRFANGPIAAKRLTRIVLSRGQKKDPKLKQIAELPTAKRSQALQLMYQGPRLRVFEIEIEGPHIKDWPPPGHQALYGSLKPEELTQDTVASQLRKFAELAFRRPLAKDELRPLLDFMRHEIEAGKKPLAVLQAGFETLLASPAFIYRNEGKGKLESYALASRLSFFLWSSMPDQQLLALARSDKLKAPDVLRDQVERMLADQRSDRFVSQFLHRWLELDNIGEMPPTAIRFFRDNLRAAMAKESQMLFRHVLTDNLPITELLTADYTFVNRELAAHYGVLGLEGGEFRKFNINESLLQAQQKKLSEMKNKKAIAREKAISPLRPRGIMGHGSFLTASANGVDTSPVVRGIYVLEKVLGYTPPPPPPDVPEREPDIRGAKSIREQLVKHREIETCAECHRKIDPMGFALENFDAIGAWRHKYDKTLVVDPSGQMPSGDEFKNYQEFEKLLVQKSDQFKRALTEKLLTYALGRELEIGDRPVIDGIVAKTDKHGFGLRNLLEEIVLSESFLMN